MDAAPPVSFGDLLRRHRLAAGMTQEELAERAQVSPRAISDLERGLRNRPWRETVQLLAAALNLGAAERTELEAVARHTNPPAPMAVGPGISQASPPPRHNLPIQVTSFVGRERELAEVKRLLADNHLLTLTGTGGCGKTRLALRVGGDLVDSYPDGVWLVELAPLADPDLIPGAVASVLGVREVPGQPVLATLLSALSSRFTLLLLDNGEHLLDACARLVDSLLQRCSHVRILATSREVFRVAGEVVFRVPSLAVPLAATSPTPAELVQFDAVRLFLDRAEAAHAGFACTVANAAAVAQICRRLDGIPLALELAAVRTRAFTVEQIATRLDQRFRLLAGGSRAALPRQQTLAALVGWSYDLLTEPERTLFNRLSVFTGGLDLEAAEGVCGHPPLATEVVLELLPGLVDKSLVVAESNEGGRERYALLETLRHYGRERLVAVGEAEGIQGRHAAYYLTVAEEAESHLQGTEQLVHLGRLDRELDNFRTTLRWYLDHGEGEAGLRIVVALEWFWWRRGLITEMRAWHTRFLQLPDARPPSTIRARALAWAGGWAVVQGDLAAGRPLQLEALAMAQQLGDDRTLARAMLLASRSREPDKEHWFNMTDRELVEGALARYRAAGDRWGTADTLTQLGSVAFREGDVERARRILVESLAMARAIGDRLLVAWALEELGLVTSVDNDAGAEGYLSEGLRLYRELGDLGGVVSDENLLGRLDALHGRYASAREHYRASLRMSKDWGWMQRVAQSLEGLATVAAGQGQPERALRLAAASARLRNESALEPSPIEQAELDRALASVPQLLGERAAAIWAEGQAMTLEQAIAQALEEGE